MELHAALDELWTFSHSKRRVPTFTLDCTDAYHQAHELEDVVVEPPEEYLNRLRVVGMCKHLVEAAETIAGSTSSWSTMG